MSQSPTGKNLNSLDFPMQNAVLPSEKFASDVKAWNWTQTTRNRNDHYPSSTARWGLAATTGASHKWHLDTDGESTFIKVVSIDGGKVWFVGVPKDLNFEQFAQRHIFQGDSGYDMDTSNTALWNVEAVYLKPGSLL